MHRVADTTLTAARPRHLSRDAVLCIAVLIAAGALLGRPAAAASCTGLKSDHVSIAESIALRVEPGVPLPVVQTAIDYWRTCRNYEEGFPELVLDGEGTRTLEVRHLSARDGAACGSLRGQTITLYSWALAPDGSRIYCGSLAQNLAHELGHALGLRDAPGAVACRQQIMSHLDASNRRSRHVDSSECQAVGQHWLTPGELRAYEEIRRRTALGAS